MVVIRCVPSSSIADQTVHCILLLSAASAAIELLQPLQNRTTYLQQQQAQSLHQGSILLQEALCLHILELVNIKPAASTSTAAVSDLLSKDAARHGNALSNMTKVNYIKGMYCREQDVKGHTDHYC